MPQEPITKPPALDSPTSIPNHWIPWIPLENSLYVQPVSKVDNLCGMEVVGASFQDAGIHHGDVILYTPDRREIEDGQLYVVQTPKGITAKYIYQREANSLLLKSANPTVADQHWSFSEITILGGAVRVDREGFPLTETYHLCVPIEVEWPDIIGREGAL
jgi:hypothetical protein